MVRFIILKILFIACCFTSYTYATEALCYPLLLLNQKNQRSLPALFRMPRECKNITQNIDCKGLSSLLVSGSSQFSVTSFQEILSIIPSEEIVVLDLREESHGFVNGDAVSWYSYRNWENRGKSVAEIQDDEQSRLKMLLQEGYARVHTKGTKRTKFNINISEVQSEDKVVQAMGAEYIRLPITDHVRPTDKDVDRFIEIVNRLKDGTWLHIHCGAGKGRTTTFLVMYDMLFNAKSVSFQDILKRQELLGGKDLTEMPDALHWKFAFCAERLHFLRAFYQYCKEGNCEPYTQWFAENSKSIQVH